jgi:NADPH2:quinone reductase
MGREGSVGERRGFGVVRDGEHAEYVTVPVAWLSEKPSRLSMEQASTVGVPYITASAALDASNLQAGETVLITGAAGSVGRAATQIARSQGARVIGADIAGHPPGLETFVDMKSQNLHSAAKALTGGAGVDVVLDAVGGPVFEEALQSLAVGGRQTVITSVGKRRVEFDLAEDSDVLSTCA